MSETIVASITNNIMFGRFYLGYGEPFPHHIFFGMDSVPLRGFDEVCDGYVIVDTRCRFTKDNKRCPGYTIFRVKFDAVFGWYFYEVKLS